MKTVDLISVIIPAYNAENYIGRCLQSIQNQTYENIEIIVVDDGSTDKTFEVIKAKSEMDSRIKLYHQRNKGVCAARNAGCYAAKGRYISFVDADDELEPHALSVLLSAMKSENAQISVGRFRGAGEHDGGFSGKKEVWVGNTALEKSLEDHSYTYSACGKLYDCGLITGLHFEEERRVHEDSFFVFQCCLKQPKVVCIDLAVYIYHAVPGSASRAEFSEKFFDILYFAERKVNYVQKEYPHFMDKTNTLLIKANMALLSNLRKANWTTYREQERKCITTVNQLKKHFIPASSFDRKWFFAITHNLYSMCKLFYKAKGFFYKIKLLLNSLVRYCKTK